MHEYRRGLRPWLYKLFGFVKFVMLKMYVAHLRTFETMK